MPSDIVSRRDESCVADLQQFGIGAIENGLGAMDARPVETLQAMQQHRAIMLVKDVTADLDDAVRTDSNEVLVVGGVVKLAERKPVRDGGLAAFAVWDDERLAVLHAGGDGDRAGRAGACRPRARTLA